MPESSATGTCYGQEMDALEQVLQALVAATEGP